MLFPDCSLACLQRNLTHMQTILQSRLLKVKQMPLVIEGLRERTEHLYKFLFSPITQSCSISDVLFTDGRRVSDFSVLKYYLLI